MELNSRNDSDCSRSSRSLTESKLSIRLTEKCWPTARRKGMYSSASSHWALTSITASDRSEEHTSELQSLMRTSYAVFCSKKKKTHSDTAPTSHAYREITHNHD